MTTTNISLSPGWMALVFFLLGFVATFFVGDIIGLPASFLWPILLILFFLFVLCLQRPKAFLVVVFIYYSTFYNGLLFGRYYMHIPLVDRMDELILIVPLALIIMKAIRRELPKEATWFPLLYLFFVFLSYKANGTPLFNTIRTTLAYFKFYIFWYFARSIGPWSEKEKNQWFWGFIALALLQLPMNMVWQKKVLLLNGSDLSIGTVGDAHTCGYLLTFALFMLGGYFLGLKRSSSPIKVGLLLLAVVSIAYDLIFFTDTKHVLVFIVPVVPILLFHPRLSRRLRTYMFLAFTLIGILSFIYVKYYYRSGGAGGRISPDIVYYSMKYSGKGRVFDTILYELPNRLPYPILGSGPGTFCSAAAVWSMQPLAEKYVLPYIIRAYKSRGGAAEVSVLGTPITSLFTLWAEFGPFVALMYYCFFIWVCIQLWRRARHSATSSFSAGQQIALIGCILIIIQISVLIEVFVYGIITMPLWTMIGIHWTAPVDEAA